FFQAEDGIRDKLVTGVQTCALPILRNEWRLRSHSCRRKKPCGRRLRRLHVCSSTCGSHRGSAHPNISSCEIFTVHSRIYLFLTRSEERRVGKECRSRW